MAVWDIKPPKLLLKPVGRAIYNYKLIKDGDKVLVAVSGGKDSLSLFNILTHFKKYAPIDYEIGVVTIDPEIKGFNPKKLTKYFKNIGTKFFLESFPILDMAKKNMKGNSYCSFCARLKRGLMYKVARREGYNVLALGQHLDDFSESLFMSICHNGKIQTMKANYINNDKDIRIIRPLVFVRERQLENFAKKANFPIIMDNCPACFRKPTEREYFKQLLLNEEKRNPNLYPNLLNAMKPILDKVNG